MYQPAGSSSQARALRLIEGASGDTQVTQKNMGGDKEGAKGAGRDGIMDLLVMENIFYGRATSRIYDLKVHRLCCLCVFFRLFF